MATRRTRAEVRRKMIAMLRDLDRGARHRAVQRAGAGGARRARTPQRGEAGQVKAPAYAIGRNLSMRRAKGLMGRGGRL